MVCRIDGPVTIGEWYYSLSKPKKFFYNLLTLFVGDIRAAEWMGYKE